MGWWVGWVGKVFIILIKTDFSPQGLTWEKARGKKEGKG